MGFSLKEADFFLKQRDFSLKEGDFSLKEGDVSLKKVDISFKSLTINWICHVMKKLCFKFHGDWTSGTLSRMPLPFILELDPSMIDGSGDVQDPSGMS